MDKTTASAEKRLEELSSDQAELLRLLIEKQSHQARRIKGTIASASNPHEPSWGQRRLWFIDQLEGGTAAYNIAIALRLSGPLVLSAFRQALDTIVERHDVLRSVLVSTGGEPKLQTTAKAQFDLIEFDLNRADEPQDSLLRKHKQQESHRQFDLGSGPLLRGRLLRLHAEEHVFLLTMHHIVSDGWSLVVFLRELSELYDASLDGRSNPLKPLSIQYADFAHWQRQWLNDDLLGKQLRYWLAQLEGAPLQLELPVDRQRPAVQSYRGENLTFVIDRSLCTRLRAVAQRQRSTLFVVLYAAWAILLSRLSGQDDIVIGTPLANRRRPEFEDLIGLFVNTLALRLEIRGDLALADLLMRAQEVTLQAFDHQDVPFERVVETLQLQRSLGRHPLFQTMISLHPAPAGSLRLAGITATVESGVDEPAKFDLELLLEDQGEEIIGSLIYAADLFDRQTVSRWIACFTTLLHGIADNVHSSVANLSVLPAAERRRVVESFNATYAAYPRDKTIHQLFEAQAQLNPDAPAVVYERSTLTYAQLNRRANQLARHLRTKGVGPDRLVALCVKRSTDLLIGILGILKAGGAYVPIDPTNPMDRLEHVLIDARPLAILTQAAVRSALPPMTAGTILLDDDWTEIAQQDDSDLDPKQIGLRPEHLAYVIYTSGSTGKPKGVMIEHRNIVNYSLYAVDRFDIAAGGGSLICTSISFDLMLTGLFPTLVSGRPVRLCPEQHGIPALSSEIPQCRDLAPLKLTPSHLALLENQLRDGQLRDSVRVLVLGGESLQSSSVELWRRHAPSTRLFNHYGPTETTVGCVVNEIGECAPGSVPIGRPISNTQIYILDDSHRPVPVGVAGEIYVGGAGVARGYLNRPELTAERFIPDPFTTSAGARLYKTGDRGRWNADGLIEYLGRNDYQVKIRGFRIELGEIEAQLRRHAEVNEAVVLLREDAPGDRKLIAYLTRHGQAEVKLEDLRTHIKAALPEYMVPAAFVTLDSFPLTPNGKLNRHALPAPTLDAYARHEYETPQGERETILATIWQELLRVERVGRRDNFFELGGHSLLLVQLKERLYQRGLSATVRDMYESQSLTALAAKVTDNETSRSRTIPASLIPIGCESITPDMLPLVRLDHEHIERIVRTVPGGAANVQDIYPLSPSQGGILFHHLLDEEGGDTYVVALLLCISSGKQLQNFIDALQRVIDRHDIMRTAFVWDQLPEPLQVVYRRARLHVEELRPDPSRDPLEQIKERMVPERQRLDLQNAPLLRLQTMRGKNDQRYVLLQVHHLVNDHESLEILVSEVNTCLAGREADLPEPLPYRNHVAHALADTQASDAETFFRSKLGDFEEPTAPFGLFDVHADGTRIDEVTQPFAPSLAQRIRVQARRLNISPATLFHAAWGIVVAHTSGKEDVVFGTVLLGRLQGNSGGRQSLGLFVNTLPLRLQLRDLSAAALIEQTQRELMELLNYEHASLVSAQRCSGVPRTGPLFTNLFNYRYSSSDFDPGRSIAPEISVLATQDRTNYPITVSIDDEGQGFSISAQIDRRLDPHRLIGYIQNAVESLVDALERAPQTPAMTLAILPESERVKVVETFNGTSQSYPKDRLVHELFEEQARRSPRSIAVVHEGQTLTYAELNRRANRLARHLLERGVHPDKPIGICIGRNPELVVAVLAVLKAGGAYVPLDPNYPHERLRQMLEDSAPRVVLTQTEWRGLLPAVETELLDLNVQRDAIEAHADGDLPAVQTGLTPNNLAYVIYTSGSTGRPKGTAMPHGSLVNLIEWHRRNLPLNDEARVLQFAALSFDVAFQEVFSTLCSGGTLVLLDEWLRRDAAELTQFLNSHQIERLFIPPLMLQSLAEHSRASGEIPRGLRDIITAGEQLRISPEIVSLFEQLGPCRLHNHYGPTETHVVTALTLSSNPHTWPTLPTIGRPLSNSRIYILDQKLQPTPVGVSGEIYIGSVGLARGYLHRPQLTNERFVPDALGAQPDARMYRTGDLGRWQPDGTIEYLGRNDHQVKIRGFRIELGEIEAQLARHEKLKDVAVVAREDESGIKQLVAYVTWRDEDPSSVEELRSHLLGTLPEHMIPSAFVTLERLPVTPSGKLDRRALPAPQLDAYASQRYEPPEGDIEQHLSQLWQQLLRVGQVGRHDNFFELGGHSLSGVKVVAAISRQFGVRLSVATLFRYPTIQQIAGALSARLAENLARHEVDEGTL